MANPNANALKGEFGFTTSDGQAYVLRLTMQTIFALESELGRDFMFNIKHGASCTEICAILYHGLQEHHPEITRERVAELMTDLGSARCALLWMPAVLAALGDQLQGKGKRSPKAKGDHGTGGPPTGEESATTPSPQG